VEDVPEILAVVVVLTVIEGVALRLVEDVPEILAVVVVLTVIDAVGVAVTEAVADELWAVEELGVTAGEVLAVDVVEGVVVAAVFFPKEFVLIK